MTSLTVGRVASRRVGCVTGGTSLTRLVQAWATVVTWLNINFYGERLTSVDPWTRFAKWVSLSFRHTRSRVRCSCVLIVAVRRGPCEPDVGCILSMVCTRLIARGSLPCTRLHSKIYEKFKPHSSRPFYPYRFRWS